MEFFAETIKSTVEKLGHWKVAIAGYSADRLEMLAAEGEPSVEQDPIQEIQAQPVALVTDTIAETVVAQVESTDRTEAARQATQDAYEVPTDEQLRQMTGINAEAEQAIEQAAQSSQSHQTQQPQSNQESLLKTANPDSEEEERIAYIKQLTEQVHAEAETSQSQELESL